MTGFLYPVFDHWEWNNDGWLKLRVIEDFSGLGVVHAVGGLAGLVACKILGHRHRVRITDADLQKA